jgi:uncharacterized protein YraI
MRNTKTIALALIILALGPRPAAAEADGPDFSRVTGVRPNDVLNIRAAPAANAAKLGTIPPGRTCIRNLGCQGGLSFQEFSTLSKAEQARRLKQNPRWCHVEYQGITGWVAGRYLAEGGCP